ncbi:MAG: FAD:protein FMN transferase, partial [Kineosporiaceae bacterium]
MEPGKRAWVEQIMGMPISIHVRSLGGSSDAGADVPDGRDLVVAQAFEQLRRVDTVFSTWKADSQISRLRRGELALQACDQEVRDVVRLCETAKDLTEGWFDAELPDAAGGRRFDPTGLVKGWAVERCCAGLSAALGDDYDVMVNAGGDVAAQCRRPDTRAWTIGVEDPHDRSRLIATVPLVG